MSYSYCTLFDSNYLDKGIVMIESLLNHTIDSKIYVLAMDDLCEVVIKSKQYDRVVVINLLEFENDDYKRAKQNRGRAEYCWTCTAGLIEYVLDTYSEEFCTYIDADLYFYSNPDILNNEMVNSGKSVLIIRHGFNKTLEKTLLEKKVGTYCVEFNTFKNDLLGRQVLNVWKNQTLRDCSCNDNGQWGDQYYLQNWPQIYSCVHVLKNLGAGVAPWNIDRYKFVSNKGAIKLLVDNSKYINLVFVHFEDIQYINRYTVNINVFKYYWKTDKFLVDCLYVDYLKKLEKEKASLEKCFGFCPLIVSHPAKTTPMKKNYFSKLVFIITNKSWVEILIIFKTKVKFIINSKKDYFNINIH